MNLSAFSILAAAPGFVLRAVTFLAAVAAAGVAGGLAIATLLGVVGW